MFFSVIIPTYNRAHLLSKAINSVLEQTFQNFELIIVDDGSTDNTQQLIENFSNDKIKYIYQENAERSAARNNGIENASGDYICFLDSDDYYHSNRLGLLYKFLEENKFKHGFYVTDLKVETSTHTKEHKIQLPKNIDEIEMVLFQNIFCQQICVSKSIFNTNKFNTSLSIGEDTELWLRIFKEILPTHIPNQSSVVVVEHEERSINWKEKNFSKKLLKMLNLVFSHEHSSNTISADTRKKTYASAYFGISKYYIWNNMKIQGFTNLLKSILSDFKNEQNKYKINILIHLFFSLKKSKTLINQKK